MTAKIIATARWRALDREGQDTCRLSRTDEGWLLVGHATFRDELGVASLNYLVRCTQDWKTQSVDLAGQHDGRKVQAKMARKGDTWWLGDKIQPDLEGARDIDLSFTPATNLMPLRRLHAGDKHLRAAWFRYPCARLLPLDQTYSRNGAQDTVSYHADQTGYSTELTVDRSGFVTLYPDLWEGEVTHEA